jgi:translation initiation factor IF-2
MAKVRIYQLAKETGIAADDILAALRKRGVKVKSNLSAIEPDLAKELKAELKGSGQDTAASSQPDKPKSGKSKPEKSEAARATRKAPAAKTPAAKAPAAAAKPAAARPAAAKPAAAKPAAARPAQPTTGRAPVGRDIQGRKPILIPAPGKSGPRPAGARPGAAGARPAGSRPAGARSPAAGPAPAPGRGTRSGGRGDRRGPDGRPLMGGRGTALRPGSPPRLFPPRRPAAAPQPKTQRGLRRREAAAARTAPVAAPAGPPPDPSTFEELAVTEGATVKELAEKMERKSKDLIKSLMLKGVMATINQPLDNELAEKVLADFGFKPKWLSFEEDIAREELEEKVDAAEDLKPRAPVVTMMGHVDHGKTSLLDAIRESKVVEREAGGITQHIGAYHVDVGKRKVVFLDTPGHEAFTRMRARGAQVTDIVVLVVAADDGVMPQTIEAIHHAKDAGVALVVAMNKMDKPEANPDRLKKALAERSILVEDWGGDTVCVPVSAKQREGLDDLLEMILLTSDLLELKANPDRMAQGTVLEARLDRARGPVATVLISNGTLNVGDSFIVGNVYGKVRAMMDDRGNRVEKAGPSSAVEILGLEGVPEAGDVLQAAEERKARQIGDYRKQKAEKERLAKSSKMSLDHLFEQIKAGGVKELRIILKADVQGSGEVLSKTLQELSTEKVQVKVIHQATGAINDSDVLLASASNAIVVGFNVRPERSAALLAEKEEVDIRLHTVIYNVTNEVKAAMVGLLEPTFKEVFLGRAEVRQVFKVPRAGNVAGCQVIEGLIQRSGQVRLLRDNVVVHEGKIGSLRRFKDDVSEVKQGFECGIGLEKYNDIKEGDIIEVFKMERVQPQEL